jgi:hypothetical protein
MILCLTSIPYFSSISSNNKTSYNRICTLLIYLWPVDLTIQSPALIHSLRIDIRQSLDILQRYTPLFSASSNPQYKTSLHHHPHSILTFLTPHSHSSFIFLMFSKILSCFLHSLALHRNQIFISTPCDDCTAKSRGLIRFCVNKPSLVVILTNGKMWDGRHLLERVGVEGESEGEAGSREKDEEWQR